MNNIESKIWECAEDLIGYASELEMKGRSESGEELREIIGRLESLVDYMKDHPRK